MFGGFQVGPFQPLPAFQQEGARSTGAGRRRKRRYYVEVDGEDIAVESPQQALAILDRVREDARKTAEARAAEVLQKVAPKALRVGKTKKIILDAPEVSGSSEFNDAIQRANEAIRKIYAEAAMVAELQLLMLLQLQRDEEETIILLME